jgi:shikimate kinase
MKTGIAIVGFMASGKSTVGKSIAKRLGISFLDTDAWIEKQEGKSITEIFEQSGEAHFRSLEGECLNNIQVDYANQTNETKSLAVIISTGGGFPCQNDVMTKLKNAFLTIYLSCEFEVLYGRIVAKDKERPLSNLDKPELLNLFKLRENMYKQADLIINTNGKTLGKICAEIIDFLQKN